RIINKALEKDRDLRYQSASELRADLKRLKRDTSSGRQTVVSGPTPAAFGTASEPPAGAPSSAAILLSEAKRHKVTLGLLIAGMVLLLGGLGLAIYKLSVRKSELSLQTMKIVRVTQSGKAIDVAVSPDGQYVVYVNREGEKQNLNVRQVATGSDVQVLPPDVVGFRGLAYSPDGNYIYFVRSDKSNPNWSYLFQMPALGGTPRQLVRDIDSPVAFSPDGRQLAFVRGVPDKDTVHVLVAGVDGSGDRILAKLGGVFPGGSLYGPDWSPDGKTLAVPTMEATKRVRRDFSHIGLRRNGASDLLGPAAAGAASLAGGWEWPAGARDRNFPGIPGPALARFFSRRRGKPIYQRSHGLPAYSGHDAGSQDPSCHRGHDHRRSLGGPRRRCSARPPDHHRGASERGPLLAAQWRHRVFRCHRRLVQRTRGWKQ